MKRFSIAVLFLMICINVYAEEEKKVDAVLAPIVITPWRIEEISANVSKNTTIVTSKDIEVSQGRYLYEVIEKEAGVIVSSQLGNPKGIVVDLRGFGEASPSNVLVLIDGRRTNQIDLSGVDWGQIDTQSIEQVEIIRGPSTILYGDNATSGIINIITKKAVSKKPTITLGTNLGSYQMRNEYASTSYANQFVDYFLNFSNTHTNGYRANNWYDGRNYFGNFNLYPVNELSIGTSFGYHKDHYGMPGALYIDGNPYAITPIGIKQVGRRGTAFDEDNGRTEDFYINAEPKTNFRIAGQDIIFSAPSSFRSRRTKGLNIPELDTWGSPHSEYETVHHIKSYDFRPKLEFDVNLFGSKIINKMVCGADFFSAQDQILSGNRLTGQDKTQIKKDAFGIYLHDNIRLFEKILLNSGVRGEWADYIFDQKELIPSYDTKDLKDAAYEIGTGFKYNNTSQVYVNFSRSYRNPNTEELYQNKFLNTWTGTVEGGLNKDIKEQTANNLEVGLKDASLSFLTFNMDYFWMGIKNEIYYDPSTYKNSNYKPKTIHHGVEINSTLHLLDNKINPFLNYTIQKSYFKGGIYANNLIPLVPKNKLSTGLLLIPLKDLEWSTSLDYVGSRFKVSDQKNIAAKLKNYITVDTKLLYAWKGLKLYGTIKNIFDEKYYGYGVTNSSGTAETFYPAQERSFEAGASFQF